AKLLLNDAPDLPRAQLELVGDRLESSALVELPLLEALHDQLCDALRIVDRGAARRQLGTAAQTRTEACLFGLLGSVEEAAVRFFRSPHRADRTAIDPG